MSQSAPIGIIGGSGLYTMEGLSEVEYRHIETPFGDPSDAILTGLYESIPVAFLARHGRGHRLLPSEIPFRANIYALKTLGVKYLMSLSAVGSLKAELKPRDFVVPDQFIDFTKHRPQSFFGEGVIAHVSMAHPTCHAVSAVLLEAIRIRAQQTPLDYHQGGTYLCIEGPQFSTRAESQWYAALGASVIGMTNLPEARLAREAQIAYSSLAMVTDYDAWNPETAHVTADMAIQNLMHNAENAAAVTRTAIEMLHQQQPESSAHHALANALITPKDQIPPAKQPIVETLLQT